MPCFPEKPSPQPSPGGGSGNYSHCVRDVVSRRPRALTTKAGDIVVIDLFSFAERGR